MSNRNSSTKSNSTKSNTNRKSNATVTVTPQPQQATPTRQAVHLVEQQRRRLAHDVAAADDDGVGHADEEAVLDHSGQEVQLGRQRERVDHGPQPHVQDEVAAVGDHEVAALDAPLRLRTLARGAPRPESWMMSETTPLM
jgi:hypothetical protein